MSLRNRAIQGGWILVLVTVASRQEAEKIARELVGSKLAACVNIIPKVESIYRWEGKVEEGEEILMIIKSRYDKFSELVNTVTKLHSYQVPEIIALPIVAGSDSYLRWLNDSLE